MLGTALHHTGTPIPPACAACYMLYPDRFHASHLAFFFSPPSLFYPKTSMSPFHPASHGFLLTLLHFVFAPNSDAASFSRPAFWALFSGKSVCWTMSDWAALLMTTGGNQTPTESLLSHFGHFVASENSNSSGLPGFPLQGLHSACRTGYGHSMLQPFLQASLSWLLGFVFSPRVAVLRILEVEFQRLHHKLLLHSSHCRGGVAFQYCSRHRDTQDRKSLVKDKFYQAVFSLVGRRAAPQCRSKCLLSWASRLCLTPQHRGYSFKPFASCLSAGSTPPQMSHMCQLPPSCSHFVLCT